MFFSALLFLTDSETLLLSSKQNEFVREVINHIVGIGIKFFNVEFLNAVMGIKFISCILLIADHAHDFDIRAVSLDVVIKLGSGHMLKLLSIADIATELRAVVLSVSLEFSKSLPDNLTTIALLVPASVWEFTEVNAVS